MTFFSDFDEQGPNEQQIHKTVYIVVFPEGQRIRDKIIRICDSFMGKRFDLPPLEGIESKRQEIKAQIKEAYELNSRSKKELKNYLAKINQLSEQSEEQVSALEIYKWVVVKEKALYHAMNNFRMDQKVYIGYFWCPKEDYPELQNRLASAPGTKISPVRNHSITPPTYFRTNEFTNVFQTIVNTYGVPTYKEVNPSVFACVSFPFLFGVMFGDMGHGFLLFTFGLLLVFGADKLPDSVKDIRYLILLMGIFATYNGFIYNEVFALPVEAAWGSCYDKKPVGDKYPYRDKNGDCVYPIGIDPRWAQSSNNLVFVNGLKMKLSVIFGITQMSLGIFMKAFNAVHFRQPIDFIFEFIPQILLLWVLFGWMDALIISKWLHDFTGPRVNEAPSIITTMINMFLKMGEVEPDPVKS